MVEIVPYRDTWREEFRAIARRLRESLGPLALRIDHIGSTSVPDLAAKDVIDIQVTVAALEGSVKTALTGVGFLHKKGRNDHRPPGPDASADAWEKWLFVSPRAWRAAHLHIRLQGAPNQRYALLFRDYLRSHPQSAEAYARLKHRLAGSLTDPERYPEVKDPAVDLIYLAAEDWAQQIDWRPGPSDA